MIIFFFLFVLATEQEKQNSWLMANYANRRTQIIDILIASSIQRRRQILIGRTSRKRENRFFFFFFSSLKSKNMKTYARSIATWSSSMNRDFPSHDSSQSLDPFDRLPFEYADIS